MSQADGTGATTAQTGETGAPPTSPDDRATTFQPVKGEAEHYSGETLLVSAYAVLWVIILVWVALVWRKQAALAVRLGDLERVIGDAAKKRGG
jgi:hypothetical protein